MFDVEKFEEQKANAPKGFRVCLLCMGEKHVGGKYGSTFTCPTCKGEVYVEVWKF